MGGRDADMNDVGKAERYSSLQAEQIEIISTANVHLKTNREATLATNKGNRVNGTDNRERTPWWTQEWKFSKERATAGDRDDQQRRSELEEETRAAAFTANESSESVAVHNAFENVNRSKIESGDTVTIWISIADTEKRMRAVLDTGAEISIATSAMLELMTDQLIPYVTRDDDDTLIRVTSIGEHKIGETRQSVTIPIVVGHVKLRVDAIVIESMYPEFILGMDVIRSAIRSIDFCENCVTVNPKMTTFSRDGEAPNQNQNKTVVEPNGNTITDPPTCLSLCSQTKAKTTTTLSTTTLRTTSEMLINGSGGNGNFDEELMEALRERDRARAAALAKEIELARYKEEIIKSLRADTHKWIDRERQAKERLQRRKEILAKEKEMEQEQRAPTPSHTTNTVNTEVTIERVGLNGLTAGSSSSKARELTCVDEPTNPIKIVERRRYGETFDKMRCESKHQQPEDQDTATTRDGPAPKRKSPRNNYDEQRVADEGIANNELPYEDYEDTATTTPRQQSQNNSRGDHRENTDTREYLRKPIARKTTIAEMARQLTGQPRVNLTRCDAEAKRQQRLKQRRDKHAEDKRNKMLAKEKRKIYDSKRIDRGKKKQEEGKAK